MLYKIKIESFRGIESLTLKNFKNINVLVGENNSGKTSIIESIFFNIGAANPTLLESVESFRSMIHLTADGFASLFNKLNTNNPIKITAEYNNPIQYRKLIIAPIKGVGSGLDSAGASTSISPSIEGIEMKFSIDKFTPKNPKYKSAKLYPQKPEKFVFAQGYEEKLKGIYMISAQPLLNLYERFSKMFDDDKIGNVVKNIIFDKLAGLL